MSAAIQLVNQPFANTGVVTGKLAAANLVANNLIEGNFNNVARFESAPEQRLRGALKYIAELEAEVGALREELAHSERNNVNYERLLRNAAVRERELRSQLGKECY